MLAAAAAAATVVVVYFALGGGRYEPVRVDDPCKPRAWPDVRGLEAVAEQVALSALDGAACRLRVTREELALALASPDRRARFLREHRVRDAAVEDAVRSGARRAVADAERGGELSSLEAAVLQELVERLPAGALIDALRGGGELLDALRGALGP